MALRYDAGATVYELAAEFGCHRATVAERLKKAGVVIRLQSPGAVAIELMASLYQSGLSYLEIGRQLGYSANTVRKYLRERQKTTNK
jgi:DNA-binding Lrp family transcriptional regulator